MDKYSEEYDHNSWIKLYSLVDEIKEELGIENEKC